MSKKNQKNCRKDNAADTTIQTAKNCRDELGDCKTEHPEHPDIRSSK